MDWLKSVHFYRKVPIDLTEATISGGAISLLSTLVMAYLFFTNFSAYLTVTQSTSIVLDSSDEKKLQLNFNVTLHHLPCRFVSLDIVDVMGTHLQNVSANILKTRVDAEGAVVGHAPTVQREIAHSTALVPAEHKDAAKFSPDLDMRTFLESVKEKRLVMVNFYAPWCPWSRRLQPVWEEAYGNVVRKEYAGDVLMGKADCTGGGQDLCQKQHVHAFPTVRVYRRHNPHSHESYVGDRTHQALEAFVENNVHDADETESLAEEQSEVSAGPGEGCLVRGVVLVNRVPGNFHLSAHSKSHSFQPHKLNMSHTVSSMTFGKALTPTQLRLLPREVELGYNGLAGTEHHSIGHNTTLEHYLKVVHTTYEVSAARTLETYQYTVNNNHYQDGESLPSAVFAYDISPMQVTVTEVRQSLAAFLTSICAIIGGVFTVTGLIDGGIFHTTNALKKKMEIGKAI
jgi:thiol-disulfide isomerase/thioredoxin|eukprot:jgi/Chrpa1/10275/Chrysochromulina_OHIO_Genome00015345-RA